MNNKRVLQTAINELDKRKAPPAPKDIITDPAGQWKFPGQVTRIPSSTITMQGVPYPVLGVPNKGEPKMMQPGQYYDFSEADYVDEYPQMRKGGGLNSKKYTRSLEGIGSLFRESALFKKSKSKKKKFFHPNAKYFQDGGEPGDKFKKRLMKRNPGMQGVYGPEGENLNIVKDPNYDARSVGYGDIEFSFPGDTYLRYDNIIPKDDPNYIDVEEYIYSNIAPDKYNTVYNPRGANRGDVFLDMMHGMRDDPNYQPLLQNFEKAVKNTRGEDMDWQYEEEVKNGSTQSKEKFDENYVDGQLRAQLAPGTIGMFSHGRKDYRMERKYDSPEMRAAAKDIKNYLKTAKEEYIEADLTPEEIQEYAKGGFIIEDIEEYAEGGDPVKPDPKTSFYTVKGSDGVYRKVNGKWEVDWNRSGNFQPLSKGDVAKRTALLNSQAKPLYDQVYDDLYKTQRQQFTPKPVNKPISNESTGKIDSFDNSLYNADESVDGKPVNYVDKNDPSKHYVIWGDIVLQPGVIKGPIQDKNEIAKIKNNIRVATQFDLDRLPANQIYSSVDELEYIRRTSAGEDPYAVREQLKNKEPLKDQQYFDNVFELKEEDPNKWDPMRLHTAKEISDKSVDFLQQWQQSPMYYEMLKNSVGDEPKGFDYYQRGRDARFLPGNLDPIFVNKQDKTAIGRSFGDGVVAFYPQTSFTDLDVIPHEYSHATDNNGRYIPEKDIELLKSYTTNPKETRLYTDGYANSDSELNKRYDYLTTPTETRARLNALRFAGKESGVYDPFTEKVDADKLKKFENIDTWFNDDGLHENTPLNDLKKVYTDEQIIEMLNTISKKDDSKKEIDVAAEGGAVCPPGHVKLNGRCVSINKKATAQDSLDLYNNAVALEKFYKSNRYKSKQLPLPVHGWEELKNARKDQKRHGSVNNKNENLNFKDYYNQVDDYRFYQRDIPIDGRGTALINTDAPMALYDSRIKPNKFTEYKHIPTKAETKAINKWLTTGNKKYPSKAGYGHDLAGVYGYDPLSVKPSHLLTDKEVKERFKKFGPSGISQSKLEKAGLVPKKSIPNKPKEQQYPTSYKPVVNNTQQKPPEGKLMVGQEEVQQLDPKTGTVTTVITPVYENLEPTMPTLHPAYVNPELEKFIGTQRPVEEGWPGVMPEYDTEDLPDYATPDPDAEWVNQTERYIDWNANRIPYRLPKFRKPGHGGDLIKPGKKRYIPIPGIETRNSAYIQREDEEYGDGGERKNKNKNKNVKPFVTSDPEEYAYRKAAYDDSLTIFKLNNEFTAAKRLADDNARGRIRSRHNSPSDGHQAWDEFEAQRAYWESRKNNPLLQDVVNKPTRPTPYFRTYGQNVLPRFSFDRPVQRVKFVEPTPNKPKSKVNNKTTIKQTPLITKEVIPSAPISEQVIPISIPVPPLVEPTPPIPPQGYPGVMPEYSVDELPMYATPDPDAEWVGDTRRYIDWDGNSVGYNLPRFRKPGHGGDLIRKGKRRYLHLPSIETRYEAEIVPEEEYAMGGEYTIGDEVELSEAEVQRLRALGYIIEEA
jgi:hypothetical protein